MTYISTLRDDFENAQIDSCWLAITSGSATATESAGRATFTLPSNTAGSHSAYYDSASTYDLTGDAAIWQIQTMVSTGVAATAFLQLILDASNWLQWSQTSNTLKAQKIVAGATTDLYSATWNASTYKYLRIREASGTLYFDSSTNGTSWTNRASTANPFAVTALFVAFGASCGNVASPGSLKIEDFNLILPALTTNWRWTQIVWPLSERFRTVTLALDTARTAQAYIALASSVDASGTPVSPTYYSGPADGGRELTQQSTQLAAQAMAVDIPVDGRFDLPAQAEGRVIRVYHRSIDGGAYTLREVYPRRLVQADDIEAESIRALHIAAASITADKLNVQQLSAITADCGTLTAGTIDGTTIYAGGSGHPITLNSTGMFITLPMDAVSAPASIRMVASAASEVAGQTIGQIDGYRYDIDDNNWIRILAGGANGSGTLSLHAGRPSSGMSDVSLAALNPSGPAKATLHLYSNHPTYGEAIDLSADDLIRIYANNVNIQRVNVGTATGAAAGEVRASGGLFANSSSAQYQARDVSSSLANNGTAQLLNATGDEFGLVVVLDSGGRLALFSCMGAQHATQEIADPSGVFSVTAGTASSTNVYWSAANSRYELENKTGGTRAYHVLFLKY